MATRIASFKTYAAAEKHRKSLQKRYPNFYTRVEKNQDKKGTFYTVVIS